MGLIGVSQVSYLRIVTIIDTIMFIDGGRRSERDFFVRRECELLREQTPNALVTRFYIFVSELTGRAGDAEMERRRDGDGRAKERMGYEVTRWQTPGVIGVVRTRDMEGRQPG